MINQICYFDSLLKQPELIAQSLVSNDSNETIRSGATLSCTSKIYNSTIRSWSFFKFVIQLMDPKNTSVTSIEDSLKNTKTSFKHKYLQLRNDFKVENKIFQQTLYDVVLANGDYVEAISAKSQTEIISFNIKENSSHQLINISENKQLLPNWQKESLYASERSESFLAINFKNSLTVYIYNSNGQEFLTKYEAKHRICRLIIQNDLLYLIQKKANDLHQLVVFNIKLSKYQITINIPKSNVFWCSSKNICFGEEYLICTQHILQDSQIHALSLSSLLSYNKIKWIAEKTATKGFCNLFFNGKDFIEVRFNNSYTCDISKVRVMPNGLLKTKIVEAIKIVGNKDVLPDNICFHQNRIFFAFNNLYKRTKIFSYDILTGEKNDFSAFSFEPIHHPFESQFVSAATNLYYLNMLSKDSNKLEFECNLTTLTCSKV